MSAVDGFYPPDWPRCACGDYVLDGHETCGRVECGTQADAEARRHGKADYCPRCNGHHEREGDAEEKCQRETQFARADHRRRGGVE